MKKLALIIGSGLGGLATAVRLLSQGYHVKIYEKENTIGGKTNQLKQGPFTFDLTASILMNREIYEEVFSDANLNYKDYLGFMKVEPTYRSFYADGSSYDFDRDLPTLVKNLESISTEDAVGYMQFLSEVYERYLVADEHFLQRTFEDLADFFKPSTLINALKTQSLSTAHQLISKYVKNEKLQNFLSYQALYVGISPYEGPSIYPLVPVISQLYGLWHIKGGMYAYVKALEKVIENLGGEIHTDYDVEEIIISNGKAVGIKSKQQEVVHADIVISNADFPYTMEYLIKSDSERGKYTPSKLKEMKYSCATFTIYLGLNKKYPQLSVHNIYINNDFKENINYAFTGQLPVAPSFYIYCPTKIDDSMTKTNGDCLSVVVRVPNLLFDHIKWDEDTIQPLRNSVLSALKHIKGLEDIEQHIEYENYLTPKDLKNRFNAYAGAAFGLSPTLTQTNYFRPHLKSDTIKNLYFVGNSVHPGPGASIVLLSSKLVTQEILVL
ncbi:phytoene desaturase family protein [Serpentinicella sp. ANB-PHB4]|uniref:phytoene desaturase family protein n=1 Tax=Serpentinicella sp. ANB-PHB4 TaxID=3074076 RepID=UPI0028574158|nr:phytoene desaturase family protein [Serpentinicella sp. ANB-PHB4]MDR5659621.1 phytoene desaturase family protein [Serpentinicella sp. ANB-PHB4]